jgi:hypothetical protein
MQIFLMIWFLRIGLAGVLKISIKLTGKGQSLYQKQIEMVFFSDLIIIFIEGYMEFCIAGYL